MEREQIREYLPRFITGSLGAQESLAISQALAEHPELMADLRLALTLHKAFEEELTMPPPLPAAIYQEARQPVPLIPTALTGSIRQLRQAADITSKVIKLAFKMI